MATQVTQCPKCRTSFRVTEAQLSIANGAVRCGSCLHIFNATEHWIGNQEPEPVAKSEAPPAPKPAATAAQPETKKTAPLSSSIQSLDDDPEPLFNDTIEQNVIDNIFDDDIELENHQQLFESDDSGDAGPDDGEGDRHELIGDSIEAETNMDDDLDISDDMLISDDLEDDEDFNIKDTGQQSIIESIDEDNPMSSDFDEDQDDETGDFSESFLEIDNWEKQDKGIFKDLDELGEDSIGNEDDWAKKLMEDEDDEDSAPAPSKTSRQQPQQEQLLDEILMDEESAPDADIDDDDPFKDIFAGMEDEEADESLDAELKDILNERGNTAEPEPALEDEFILGDEPLVAGERIGNEKLALLANIEPEPVVFSTTLDRGRWIRIGWIAGIVFAVLLFGFQYIAYNFDRLARDDSYRGILSSACGLFGCSIPDRDDIGLIRSTNLMVRSHPKAASALVVDAIITNRASFRQRFPDLELQFTDLSGNLVAAREFTPEEYLSGEVTGMKLMPSNQPIHIALEIVDPGSDAVNYQMRLQANKNR